MSRQCSSRLRMSVRYEAGTINDIHCKYFKIYTPRVDIQPRLTEATSHLFQIIAFGLWSLTVSPSFRSHKSMQRAQYFIHSANTHTYWRYRRLYSSHAPKLRFFTALGDAQNHVGLDYLIHTFQKIHPLGSFIGLGNHKALNKRRPFPIVLQIIIFKPF